MRFGSHLSCLKSVTVWQPSAQNSSDSVKISKGQIAIMTLCTLQLKMPPNVIGIKEGSTVSAERQQSGQKWQAFETFSLLGAQIKKRLLGGDPRADPELVGVIAHLIWPGPASRLSRKSCKSVAWERTGFRSLERPVWLSATVTQPGISKRWMGVLKA